MCESYHSFLRFQDFHRRRQAMTGEEVALLA